MIIVANTEDEALTAATAQMGSAARIEFVSRSSSKRNDPAARVRPIGGI